MICTTKHFALPAVFLSIVGCAVAPARRSFNADGEQVRAAVRAVMAAYPSAREMDGKTATSWEDEPVAVLGPSRPIRTLHLRARYTVWVEANVVELTLQAESFVSYGPHHHSWGTAGELALRNRFFERIEDALKRN